MLNFLRKADIAVDLGTSKIAVFIRGEGLVLEEPACIGFSGTPDKPRGIVAIGHEAARMRGRTPQGLFVVNPIQDGVISDCRIAGILLRALLAKHGVDTRLARRRFLVGTLFGATCMERRSFEQVARQAGAGDVVLVKEPFAAAVGANLPIEEPGANMVVDVGGGAAEAIVVSLKRVVAGGSIRIGGDTMNDSIIQALHRGIGLDIGTQEARRLKETIAGDLDPNTRLETRGLDVRLGRPRRDTVLVGDLRAALSPPLSAITEMVRKLVDGLSAELTGDLMDRGITLAGGGAATLALQKMIEDAIHVAVKPLASPHHAVINGCGRMLDDYDSIA